MISLVCVLFVSSICESILVHAFSFYRIVEFVFVFIGVGFGFNYHHYCSLIFRYWFENHTNKRILVVWPLSIISIPSEKKPSVHRSDFGINIQTHRIRPSTISHYERNNAVLTHAPFSFHPPAVSSNNRACRQCVRRLWQCNRSQSSSKPVAARQLLVLRPIRTANNSS